MRGLLAVAALAALMLSGGCGFTTLDYLLLLAAGQAEVLEGSEPISEALAGSDLDASTRAKLLWVQEVREFATGRLGLEAGESYRLFYDTSGGPAVWNISAAPKDRLTAASWTMPVIGAIEYVGFFDLKDALAYERYLEGLGLDVWRFGAVAYSTAGIYPDPLFSPVLELAEDELAETVIHELTHNTVFAAGNSAYNESVATFVGRRGAEMLMEERFGTGSELAQRFDERRADEGRTEAFMSDLIADLEGFYSREDLGRDEKIAGRDAVFASASERFATQVLPEMSEPARYAGLADLPANNAFVLLHRRYHLDLELFESVYEAASGDLPAAIRVFREAAGTDDPYGYLRSAAAGR